MKYTVRVHAQFVTTVDTEDYEEALREAGLDPDDSETEEADLLACLTDLMETDLEEGDLPFDDLDRIDSVRVIPE